MDYIEKNDVETIVLGLPKDLQNEDTNITADVLKFSEKLKTQFAKLNIEMFDERFTSKMARQSLFDSGVSKKKRRNKGLVDEVSATIILQSYMSHQQS